MLNFVSDPTKYIQGLCYKLRMRMGVKFDEPALEFGDNKSVLVCNARAPASTLNKFNAIMYHFV